MRKLQREKLGFDYIMTIKDEIAKLAYELYKKRMGKEGKELGDWLKAERIILDKNKCRKHLRIIMTMISPIATVIMAVIMAFQSISINSQTASLKRQTDVIENNFVLEKRPYLYVDVEPTFGYDINKQLLAGAIISYKNAGSVVANNIKTEVKIADDGDGDTLYDMAKWFEDHIGTYPYVRSVFPTQQIPPAAFTANISPFPIDNIKYVYVGIRIRYSDSAGRPYSYGVDYIYILEKDSTKRVIKNDTFWDENASSPLHHVKAPDWSIFKKRIKDIRK